MATVISPPSITASSASRAISARSLEIDGANFDPTAAGNSVVLDRDAVATVSSATSTSLSLTYTTLPMSTGNLTAVVSSFGVSSGQTQVATVVADPTVSPTSTTTSRNAAKILVTGTGFDAATPSANIVALSRGAAGTVTAANATSLTVTITTPPTSAGALTAVVSANGGTSGSPVQVANIVSTPAYNWCVFFSDLFF